MPFRVAEVEVMLLADPVTAEYEPVEAEELELLEVVEESEDLHSHSLTVPLVL